MQLSRLPDQPVSDNLSTSWFEDDDVDYILINDNLLTSSEWGFGVGYFDGTSGLYNLDLEQSLTLNDPPAGPTGIFQGRDNPRTSGN